ncbi:MAG: trypsin-like peptidase domain-containing protein [Clostridia bacterium]|nr:trypsin-like peptidase domain-containing protein [Clostridia bacterium]
MSVFNGYDRDQIYEEMDGPSKGSSSKAFNIISKTLSVALLLSLGFASGSLYSTYQKNNNYNERTSTTPVISTSTNNNASTPYTLSHTDISSVVEKCANSVVEITIETQNTIYGYYTYKAEGNGSGVIITNDGYILTNNHVIKGASKITVTLRDGTQYEAKLIGKDSKTDIAIIKIDAKNLTPASLGNSDSLVVGEVAIAIGNPLGQLGGTVTDGIISALEREIKLDNSTMNLIQTNAAINPGNSGGGLFNANGDLIGVVVAKSSGFDIEGLGFAIPINDVKNVINDLLEHGYATNRAFLGVSLKDTSYTTNNGGMSMFSMFMQSVNYGAAVDSVVEGSPAEKAGIQKDDIIVSVDNEVVSSSSDVTSKISSYSVGDKVTIGLIRGNKTMNVEVTLAEYKGE